VDRGCHTCVWGVSPRTHARRRRVAACLFALVALAVARADIASAHAVIRPAASRPADLQLYTLVVPNEREVATVGVDLKIPAGIDFVLVEGSGAWKARLVRVDGRVDEVRWSGAPIQPGFFGTLRFVARNPITPGSIAWRVVQRYGDGKDVHWIGPPESDTPAARTLISESATPVDVLAGLNGGASASSAISRGGSGSGTPTTPTSDASSSGRDGLTFGLAIVAVVLGAAALAAAFLPVRRRRAASPAPVEGAS
jgi:uncharacterized protein YcnI